LAVYRNGAFESSVKVRGKLSKLCVPKLGAFQFKKWLHARGGDAAAELIPKPIIDTDTHTHMLPWWS